MRSPLILVVACVMVLAGAIFASRTLVNDVPAPPPVVVTPTTLAPASEGQPGTALLPSAPRPAVNRAEVEAAMHAMPQGAMQPVNSPQVLPRMEPNAPPPVAEVAPSPFSGESKELDYAEGLMAEANPGLDRLQSAHQVFSRCVEQEPANERCKAGLAAAQQRLGGKAASERTPGVPTLKAIPPHARPPSPVQ